MLIHPYYAFFYVPTAGPHHSRIIKNTSAKFINFLPHEIRLASYYKMLACLYGSFHGIDLYELINSSMRALASLSVVFRHIFIKK